MNLYFISIEQDHPKQLDVDNLFINLINKCVSEYVYLLLLTHNITFLYCTVD